MKEHDDTVLWFEALGRADVPRVGGKNASLGEMVRHLRARGVAVPPGFATTANAYWRSVDLLTPGKPDRALPSKIPHMNIPTGGRFVCYGPAGGGYGNPLERDPAKVVDDVMDEVISVETALRDYGVVVSARGVVDTAATTKARADRT